MTKSEKQFEQFCKGNNINFLRLSPDGNKTPDYKIDLGGQPVVVEIKELTPNDEEKQAIRDFKEKRVASWGMAKVGNRVRYKIDNSKEQISRHASGKCPGILLLYDARPFPVKGISPYEIEVAMYGWESIDLHIPQKHSDSIRFGKHRFGKGKKLRPDCRTYISAIGVLREVEPNCQLHLDLYQNIYTDMPLSIVNLVCREDITVFTVAPGEGNEFRGWARIVPDE